MRVLITGANGSAGRVAVTAIKEAGHFVRGFDRAAREGDGVYDRSPSEARWHAPPDEFVQADLTDKTAMAHAMEGIDVVLNLAATPDDLGEFDAPGGIMHSNVLGVYVVCDAARTAGVRRVMLCSSGQAVGGLRIPEAEHKRRAAAGGPTTILSDGTAPTNFYALTKLFSESLGAMYARGVEPRFPEPGNPSMQPTQNRMSVIVTRLGWFPRNVSESAAIAENGLYSRYLSHDDAARYFVRVVKSPTPLAGECLLCFAQSRTPDGYPEERTNDEARQILGYAAQDVYPHGSPFLMAHPWPDEALQLQQPRRGRL